MFDQLRRDRSRVSPHAHYRILLRIGALDLAVRGADYSMSDSPRTSPYLSHFEPVLPIEAHGVLCVLAALLVLAGISWYSQHLLRAGCILAAVVYALLASGRFEELVAIGWPPDGWRGFAHFACMSLSWAYVAALIGDRLGSCAAKEVPRLGPVASAAAAH